MTAVLFDLDGVLADSRAPFVACVSATLAERGHPARRPEELHPMIGPPLQAGFSQVLGLDPGDPEIEALIEDYRSRYRDALHETPGFPGMTEALDELRGAGLRLGVATSKPEPFAGSVLAALGIRDRFDVVAAPSFDGVESKTQTVERALDRLGPSTFAMVGDRRFDMVAARAHGLHGVGVTWGIGSRAELEEAGADAIVETPEALVVHLLQGTPRAFADLPPNGG